MVNESSQVIISAIAGVTPVGDNPKATGAALEAGISAVQECFIYQCENDEGFGSEDSGLCSMASVPLVDRNLPLNKRLCSLLRLVLQSLIHDAEHFSSVNTSLFIALPQEIEEEGLNTLKEYIHTQLSVDFHWLNQVQLKLLPGEPSDFFQRLNDAQLELTTGNMDCCILVGLDSWIDKQRLKRLDNERLLKSGRNRDGFIPGEACCLLVIETQAQAKRTGRKIIAKIDRIGQGVESNDFHSGKNSSGEGLASAISNVFDEEFSKFDVVYCDLNGESYRAFEWGLILSRLGKQLDPVKNLVCPAEACGDTGSASGSLLLVGAAEALQKAPSVKHVLVWVSGRGKGRTAVSLRK